MKGVCAFVISGMLLIACVQPQLRQLTGCRSMSAGMNIVDLADPGPATGMLFLAVQDRSRTDLSGEYLNDGRIVGLNRRTLDATEIPLQGRDEYPFKPLGLDAISERSEVIVYVVNEAFRDQRSIEIFKYIRGNLQFQKRIRTDRLNGIHDVVLFSPDEFVIVRDGRGGLLAFDGDLILHRNLTLRYLSLKSGGSEHINRIGDRRVLIPNGRNLLEFDVDRLSLKEHPLSLGRASPVAAIMNNDVLYVLHRDRDSAFLSVNESLYRAPFLSPSTFFVMDREAKIMIGRQNAGLSICDLPAP